MARTQMLRHIREPWLQSIFIIALRATFGGTRRRG